MDKRRSRTEEQLEYYANLSDSECDKVSSEPESGSSDYKPSQPLMKSSPSLKMKLFPRLKIITMLLKQRHQIRTIICEQKYNKSPNNLCSNKTSVSNFLFV
ncbi:hypothetical protein CBL_20240 [Carabus blaptoides fortunei]